MAKFTEDKLKKLSMFSLEKYLEDARVKFDEVDSSDATALKAAEEKFELLDAEMSRRSAPGLSTTPAAGKQLNMIQYRTLQEYMNKVTNFQPGQDVVKFIHQLDNAYKCTVNDENGLESEFCRLIPNSMCDDYKTNILKLPEADRLNFSKVKEYLMKSYQTHETIYQTMSKVWNLQQSPGEDIHSFGSRMEEKCLDIFNQIETKFLEEQKANSNGKTDFEARDAFLLMGSMLMVQHVRSKEPEAYKLMVRDIDNVFTPAQIALRAQSYVARIGTHEPAAVNNGTFHSNKPNPHPKKAKKDLDCHHWKRFGTCKFKDGPKDGKKKCEYRHADKFKKDKKPKPQQAMHTSGKSETHNQPTTPAPITPQPGPPPTPHPYYGMPQYFHPSMHNGTPQANPSFNFADARRRIEDHGYENMGQEVFHQN